MHRITLVLALLLSVRVTALAQEPLRFVYTSYEPANYLGADGDHRGFFVDIIREALETRLGVPVSMDVYPWARCQYMVKEGLADMMATIPTPERREYAVVVEPPIWIKRYKVYTVAGHPAFRAMGAVRSVEDLKRSGLTVVSYLGNDWSKATLEAAGIVTVCAPSVEGMYRMLLAGRADVVVEDPSLAYSTLRGLGLADQVIQTPGVVEESAFHLMIGDRSPYAGLSGALGRALADMMADGTIDAIMSRYR